jgi:hypothetical protein
MQDGKVSAAKWPFFNKKTGCDPGIPSALEIRSKRE